MRRARSRSPRDRVSQALAITRCDFKNVPDRSISTQPHTHGLVTRCASIAGLQELYAAPKRSREQRPTAYRLGPRSCDANAPQPIVVGRNTRPGAAGPGSIDGRRSRAALPIAGEPLRSFSDAIPRCAPTRAAVRKVRRRLCGVAHR